jgi:Flp pilus assembly pilin Flp
MKDFLCNQEGQSITEHVLFLALIGVVTVLMLSQVSTGLTALIENLTTVITHTGQ